MASSLARPALTIVAPGTRNTTQDSGTRNVPDKDLPMRRCVLVPLAVTIETKTAKDCGPALSSGVPIGSRGRCYDVRGRERSSSKVCLPCSSTLTTHKARQSFASTLYHQKLLLPSQHYEQNGVAENPNTIWYETTINPISLIFDSGFDSSKSAVHSFASFRAMFFAFLLLSNCLLSSALRLDPVTIQETRSLRDSIPDSSYRTTLNTNPHSGNSNLFTNTNDNSMHVDDVREISVNSNPIPRDDVLHQSHSTWNTILSSDVVAITQDKIQPSFYRSSTLYASDGSLSGTSSNPIIDNGSETRSNNSDTNIGTSYNSPTGRPLRAPDSCEVSNIKCALRTGCGMALQKYMLDCADLINGHTDGCDSHCRDSLLILTSTSEGRALMDCVCSNDYCRATKARLEVCRTQVLSAGAQDGALSCRLAHLVCTADTLCATAIAYYDKFCRRMFIGRSCSLRCNNSIAILQRQQQASRLETCHCDGSEPFACSDIKSNMARLCFHQVDQDDREKQEEETNEIDTSPVGGRGPPSKSGAVGVTGPFDVISRLLMMSLLLFVLQFVIQKEARL